MSTLDRGHVRVFTYKDGLLARVAHDLRFALRRWKVTVDGDAVTGVFPLAELALEGTMKNGALDPDALKAKDRAEISRNVGEVLKGARHPELRFEGELEGDRLKGALTMAGRTEPVEIPVTRTEEGFRGRVTLKPTRWGIPPYKALMGAIKLQDRVDVEFDLS